MTDDDAELLEAFALWCQAEKRTQERNSREYSLLMREMLGLEQQIATTPASGVVGIAVKLTLFAQISNLKQGDPGSRHIASAYADATRICGRDLLAEMEETKGAGRSRSPLVSQPRRGARRA
jgi:hypothetical protein